MEHTIKQLEQLKINAIYGKKKHYNAADRKRKYYNRTSFALIILNAIIGSTILTAILGEGNKIAEILALILSIFTVIFTSILKLHRYEQQAVQNDKTGDAYLRVCRSIDVKISLIKDKKINDQDVIEELQSVEEAMNHIDELAKAVPTNKQDYIKAQKGIQLGEENYSEVELNIL